MLNKLDDQYILDRKLGEGATAKVYLAHDAQSQTPVALKQMLASAETSPTDFQKLAARFLQEGDTLGRIQHAHVPQVFAVGKWQGAPAIVMEYIDGQKLYDYIQTKPAFHELLLRLAETADALHHAHSQGIVHRDLKPENIMVTSEKGAYLMDFGVARQEESVLQTSDGTMLGTIAYMAPEQLYNSAKADARCDIYSLGVVMYEVITGQLPFDGASPAAMILQIFNYEPMHPTKVLPDLHKGLAELIMRCLHKDSQKRVQTAKEIYYMLQEIAQEIHAEQNYKADLNRTQLIFRRSSTPIDTTQKLGDVEGLQQSAENGDVELKIELRADGAFNQFGLLLALEQAIIDGFTGALKIKAKQPDSQMFWFKGVIWFIQGRLTHAQLIRESLNSRHDLEDLLQTSEGQFQRTDNTPSPNESLGSENSLELLAGIAHKFGLDWQKPRSYAADGTCSLISKLKPSA